jgi:membrane protease YdiL (CAAX protease family)
MSMNAAHADHVPAGLSRHTFHAWWWTVGAPFLYPLSVLALLSLLAPPVFETMFGEGAPVAPQWQVYAVISLVLAWRLVSWSERNGFGPLAGPLNLRWDWALAAAITGPLLVIGAPFLVGMLSGQGDSNWAYREEADADLLMSDPDNLTMLAFVILLAPFIEEVGFRGVAMGWMVANGRSGLAATIITAFAFALIHLQYTPLGMVAIFLVGLGLGALRMLSRGMSAPLIAHASGNAAVLWLSAASPSP